MGCHKQVKKKKPTGTSVADIIRLAKLMFQVKSTKGSEFTFKHCWVLVKDFLRWANGWGTMKQTTPSKRRASSSAHDSVEETQEGTSAVEGTGDLAGNAVLRNRLVGTKSAKASQKVEKQGCLCVRACVRLSRPSVTSDKVRVRSIRVNVLLTLDRVNLDLLCPRWLPHCCHIAVRLDGRGCCRRILLAEGRICWRRGAYACRRGAYG
jgi:hypothetical protein